MKIALSRAENGGLVQVAGLDENEQPIMAVKIPIGKAKKMFPYVDLFAVLNSEESRAILYPDWDFDDGEFAENILDPDHLNESELD